MTGNVLLYPKFDTSKEIVYKLNDDGIAYSAYSFGTLDNSSKDITISSVFMGKEVEKISKNCFSNEDSLKIESLFIPETVSVIENNSFVYLLNLNKLTIPVFSNYFSFSKLFGTNDEFIISHLKYLKITGGSLERFVISTENSTGLEGLQYLKIIQELHLPYSIDDFYDSTIDFLAELQNLRDFKIEVRENSSQKFYVAEYNSSSSTFQIMRNATGTIAYEFKRNNGNIIDEVELKYSISFIDNELNQLKTPLTNLSIGEKLVNFNTSEDYIPTKEGYTFVGWWYYEEVDGVVELTEPYIYEDLKVMFAENVQLCAKFIKGNVVVENNIIVSISELSEEENILVIEKYYRGNLLEGIDLTSMESTLEYVQAIEFPDSIKKITLSGKVPALQSISMAANMYQCVVDDKSKCKAVEIYKSAIGKSNIPETATLEIKIIHSDNDSINQIIDAFDGLEKINITKLTLPSSLIFDILSYPMMFKELHNVSGYAITDIDGYNNVVVGENGCLYGLVYNTSNETEWALLRSPMRSVSEELSTGTLVGKESIKQIAPYAFYKIHNITKITMNDGKSNSQIYILGDYSFASMDDLTSIMIGMSVREISKFAFDSSYSITEFDIDQFNGVYSVLDGVLFKSHETILVKYPANKDASYYAIPLGVKEIAEYAFMLNENIGIDLEIGKNVITISGYSNFSEFAYWEELKLNNFVNVKSFIVDEDNAVFTSVNGSLYSKDYSVLIRFGKNSDSKQVLLLPSIKTIFKDAFLYNTENLISYLSKQIECILIDNANNEDLSELLGDSEHGIGKYFSNLGFNAQNLIIYFGTFEGFADLETNPMYTVVTPDSSFRLYTEGNLHIGGEELHIGNNKEYFEYADLMINEAPVTSSSSVFIGWYLDSDYQIPAKFPLLSITNGSLKYVSLYAKFGTSYLVTFDSKGGTSIESINYIDVITKDTLPINPEKTGYKFGGWYLDSALTKPLFSETESYELSLPTTPLYAKWNVEVTIYVRDIETYTFKILNSVNGESWYFGTGDSLNKHLGEEYNKYRWYTDSDCTNEISYSRAINSSITIYGIPYHEVEIEIVYLEEDKVTELDRRQISVDVALETTINQLDVYQELIGAYIIKSIYLDKNESAATNSTSAISFNVNFIRIYCYMM